MLQISFIVHSRVERRTWRTGGLEVVVRCCWRARPPGRGAPRLRRVYLSAPNPKATTSPAPPAAHPPKRSRLTGRLCSAQNSMLSFNQNKAKMVKIVLYLRVAGKSTHGWRKGMQKIQLTSRLSMGRDAKDLLQSDLKLESIFEESNHGLHDNVIVQNAIVDEF